MPYTNISKCNSNLIAVGTNLKFTEDYSSIAWLLLSMSHLKYSNTPIFTGPGVVSFLWANEQNQISPLAFKLIGMKLIQFMKLNILVL